MATPDPAAIRAVLFDFDGTLAVATLDFPLMRERARQAMAAFVPVLATAGLAPAVERPVVPVMEELARLCASLDPERAAEARGKTMAAIKEVEMEAAARSRLFPFTRPMLAALRHRGIPCAVVTRNCPAAVYTVFPDMRDHFACVLTRDDVAHVKPHPEHAGTALELMDRKPGEALIIGDHPMDVETGKRLGLFTAGVHSGESSRAALAEAGPDWLAEDAGALMRQLGLMS